MSADPGGGSELSVSEIAAAVRCANGFGAVVPSLPRRPKAGEQHSLWQRQCQVQRSPVGKPDAKRPLVQEFWPPDVVPAIAAWVLLWRRLLRSPAGGKLDSEWPPGHA